MISIEKLSDVFVEMADTLVDDYDSVDFLHQLTEHAAAISGAEAVGLMLGDHQRRLQFFAASSDTGRQLGLSQLQLGEGPGLDCFTTRAPVVNAELALPGTRWPRFAPVALAAGVACAHAFPMRLRQEVIGALSLFTGAEVTLDPADQRVVQSLADIATIAILQERNITRAEALTEQLQGAFNSRIVIEQAKGALAQQEGITPDMAFHLLRDRARSAQRKLVDVAREVLEQIS
ncbi:GAF and ANTAR domain-containing protein [soil metagenome]